MVEVHAAFVVLGVSKDDVLSYSGEKEFENIFRLRGRRTLKSRCKKKIFFFNLQINT